MNKSKAIALKVRCKFAALLCVVMLLTSLLPTFSVAFAADRRTRSTVCTDAQGNRYAVSVSYTSGANIPDDAELTVREISPDEEAYGAYLEHTEAVLCGENETLNNARFLDISLVSHEDPTVQYQPADGAKVQVHIQLEAAPQCELSVVHFAEEAPPEVLSNTVNGDTLQFETTGFSVYAIVDAPESNNTNFGDVETEATGLDGSGFYLGAGKSERVLYWMRTGTVRTSNAGVVINRTVANDPTLAEMYYFQRVPGDQEQYYLYYKDDQGGFHYVKLTGETNAEFVSSAANATAFSIESCGSDGPNRFYLSFKQGGTTYYLNLRKGDSGQGFSGSTFGKPQKDKGSMFYLCKYFTSENDPYGLDGKTTGIILMKNSTDYSVIELTNTALDDTALTAKEHPLNGNPLDPDQALIYADGDLSQWTFESIGGKEYYLKTTVDGQTKYLRLTETGAMLVDTPDNNCKITATVGTGSNAGKYRFSCTESGTSLALNNGGTANGFGATTSTGSANAWFKLADLSVLQEDDLVSYVAKKVSISDRSRIKNGSKVVIYYRMWNESTKKYDFYALDHDGSLVYLYDEGDTLRWTGSQINSLLWDFTEYYYWFTNIPNGYYELQNEYSGKYLAPQINGGQILSDSPVGINLTGRRHGEVDSTILAWDNRYYDYAALRSGKPG